MTLITTDVQADLSPLLSAPGIRPRLASLSPKTRVNSLDRHYQMLPSGPSSTPTHFLTNMFQSDGPTNYAQASPIMAKGKAPPRRASRFDPMMREDELEMEEEGYGDLGQRHPLRRVKEEMSEQSRPNAPESISLPGIKSLFGVAGTDRPPIPSPSSLFQSPSLPSLIPGSPSTSPSSARTSRYSSLASSAVPDNVAGWWLPDFDGMPPMPSGVFNRSSSYPTQPYNADVHDNKRRRSDGPPALRDAEESARLRWAAQNRNASYPMESPFQTPSASSHGLRGMLHPPPASSAAMSAAMSRGSISGSTAGGTLSPTVEHTPHSSRRPSAAPRSSSLVGGQLSRHFADLTTASAPGSSASDMPPPLSAAPSVERRPSSFFPPAPAFEDAKLLAPPPAASISRPSSRNSEDRDQLRRQSLTRPSSPEAGERPTLRRSSLTEIIMAKSGDNVAMAKGQYGSPARISSVAMEKPSVSEPLQPIISGWTGRRESTQIDDDGLTAPMRSRKRSAEAGLNGDGNDDADVKGDLAMRGMDVLAESATRVAELEERTVRKDSEEDRDLGNTGSQAGPKYACAYCAKTFSRPSSLRIHTYSHTGERPYVCKEPSCRRRFSVQSNLKRHAKVHQVSAAGHGEGPLHDPHHGHRMGHPPPRGHPHLGMRGPPQHHHGQPTFHPPPSAYPYSHPPPPGFSPGPPPGPHGYPYPDQHGREHGHFGMHPRGPGREHSHGPGSHRGGHLLPPHMEHGYHSPGTSRRTSRDEDWSEREGEEEEDEEIDELDED